MGRALESFSQIVWQFIGPDEGEREHTGWEPDQPRVKSYSKLLYTGGRLLVYKGICLRAPGGSVITLCQSSPTQGAASALGLRGRRRSWFSYLYTRRRIAQLQPWYYILQQCNFGKLLAFSVAQTPHLKNSRVCTHTLHAGGQGRSLLDGFWFLW
jgi:hypothetical protein